MKLSRFQRLADLYGGTLDRWPESVRPAAEQVLASEPRAVEILAEAAAVDHGLDAARVVCDADTTDRLLRAIDDRLSDPPALGAPMPWMVSARRPAGWAVPGAMVLALVVVLGLTGFLAADPARHARWPAPSMSLASLMTPSPLTPWLP